MRQSSPGNSNHQRAAEAGALAKSKPGIVMPLLVVMPLLLAMGGLVGCSSEGASRGAGSDMDLSDGGMTVPDEEEAVCGDKVCSDSENCRDCPIDCGECPTCSLAPTCSGAVAIPVGSELLEAFDNAGEALVEAGLDIDYGEDKACLAPELKFRLRRLVVEDEGNLWGIGDVNLFCAVQASDGYTSELIITPLQTGLNNGDEVVFEPTQATFWGQNELKSTMSNITITYKCYKATEGTFKQVLETVEDGALGIGMSGAGGGPYGWVFGAGGIAAGILADVTDGAGEERVLDVQQTIAKRALLDLTNGRIWNITDDIRGAMRLEIEAWGCADSKEPLR